jgi:hypothetical protein
MSMGVDLSTPLTPEEAQYLHNRGRDAELQGTADRHGQDVNELLSDQSGDGTAPVVTPLNTNLQQMATPEALLARLRDMGVNVQVVDEPGDDADDAEPDVSPYEEWPVKDLDAELKRRNLPVTGDKQAKLDRLYADDEKA